MTFRPNPGHLSMADTCTYCIALHNVPRDRLNVLLITGCSGRVLELRLSAGDGPVSLIHLLLRALPT